MTAHVLQLRSRVSDAAVEAMAGARLRREQLPIVSSVGDVDIYRPDGAPLIMIRRGAVPQEVGDTAFPHLHLCAHKYSSENRGAYAGLRRGHRLRPDGSLSKNSRTMDDEGNVARVKSGVMGYFDRQGGYHPYCRAVAFTGHEADLWGELQPLFQAAARAYAEAAPKRYATQLEAAKKVHPDWVVKGTPFTTFTVNSNVLGAIHTDKGDFKEGMGVITCHRRGTYAGALLGFPQYGVGVELFDRDLILFNPHEWHGVTNFEGELSEDHERVTVVYYMRRRMVECGSAAEEFQRARSLKEDLGDSDDAT